MKPKDYMVGDWVATEHDFPMRVTTVGEDYIYADFEGNEGDEFEFDDKYLPKPILLTLEILEKNGFNHHGCVSKNEQYRVIIQHWSKDNLALNKVGRHENPVFIPDLVYVHELQHALRLCGLDELADNFKVE